MEGVVGSNESTVIRDLLLLTSTDKAYLVRMPDDDQVWIPKSQVRDIQFGKELWDDAQGRNVKEIESLEIPEWLAQDKGMI